jgi:hypothetical protein
MFLQNVGWLSTDYMASYRRRQNSSGLYIVYKQRSMYGNTRLYCSPYTSQGTSPTKLQAFTGAEWKNATWPHFKDKENVTLFYYRTRNKQILHVIAKCGLPEQKNGDKKKVCLYQITLIHLEWFARLSQRNWNTAQANVAFSQKFPQIIFKDITTLRRTWRIPYCLHPEAANTRPLFQDWRKMY